MKNQLCFAVLFLFLCCGCRSTKDVPKQLDTKNFLEMMGSGLPEWRYVQTKEDYANLDFFGKIFEANISHLAQEHKQTRVPHTIHFIWVGPKAFPITSIENVRNWMAHHPDWTFKFWTDRVRPLPHPDMELCLIQKFPFRKLKKYYSLSDNYGEKSDLLRIEILYREGGIYIDHDVKCMKNFDDLSAAYDFFCGMELPYPSTLSSPLTPTNNLIGSKQRHIMLDKMMDWLEVKWDLIEEAYPGRDHDAVICRIAHRTFSVLGEVFKQHANIGGNIDIALPTYYFNSPTDADAIYSRHTYEGTWFDTESEFEKNVRKRLMKLSKKSNQLLLFVGVLSSLNVIGFASLFFAFRRKH